MVGYIALFIVGLLFFACLVYVLRFLVRVIRKGKLEEDPLLDALEVSEAQEELKSGKVLGVFIYGVSFFGLLWYMFYYEPAPSYEVTAFELYEEFSLDKALALEKFKGEFVLVSGKYVGNEVKHGNQVVMLQTPIELEPIHCKFQGNKLHQLSSLTQGDEVILKGRVLGKYGNVVVEKCSVTE